MSKKQTKRKTKTEKALTVRDRKLIEGLLAGKSAKAAMIDAGYSRTTANSRAKDVLGKPRVQQALAKALEKEGIDDSYLAKKVRSGLDAYRVVSAIVAPSGDHADASEATKDFIEVPDFQAQHRFLDTALKLLGKYPDERLDIDMTVETYEQRQRRLIEQAREKKGMDDNIYDCDHDDG